MWAWSDGKGDNSVGGAFTLGEGVEVAHGVPVVLPFLLQDGVETREHGLVVLRGVGVLASSSELVGGDVGEEGADECLPAGARGEDLVPGRWTVKTESS